MSFSTYDGNYSLNNEINNINWNNLNPLKDIYKYINFYQKNYWKSHSLNYTLIPFCAVINHEDLQLLSGYDEKFEDGVGFDDFDFVERIDNIKLKTQLIDHPFCIHQMHEPSIYSNDINVKYIYYLRDNFKDRIKPPLNKIYVK